MIHSCCMMVSIIVSSCRWTCCKGDRNEHMLSVISVVPRETTLTILDLTDETVSMESEKVREASLGTTETSKITQLKMRSSGSEYLNPFPHNDTF